MRNLVDILALGFAKALVFTLRRAPDPIATLVARGVVRIVLLFMPRLPAVSRTNLKLAYPELTTAEREAMVTKSFHILADNLIAYARVPDLTKELAPTVMPYAKSSAHYDKLHEQYPGVGILHLIPHFGRYEAFLQVHALSYGPVSVLIRGFGLPRLDAWWNARREMFGVELFGRKGGYKELVKRLKAGKDVMMMPDQNVKKEYATFAEFFGKQAATTKTFALAAIKTGCPVVVGGGVDRENGAAEMIVLELPHISKIEGTRDERVQKFSALANEQVEKLIRMAPEQWFWVHRRWKTRPPGDEEKIYQ